MSGVHVACPHCNHEFGMSLALGSAATTCPDCGKEIYGTAEERVSIPRDNRIPCPYCGEKVLPGVEVCTHCQMRFNGGLRDGKNKKGLKCYDCKELLPVYASEGSPCPMCGAKNAFNRAAGKKLIKIAVFLGAWLGFILLFFGGKSQDSAGEPSSVATVEKAGTVPSETRQEQIDQQFRRWGGAHYNLEKLIKKTMDDPTSYQHVKTQSWDHGDYLIVRTEFRAKNASGDATVNMVEARVDLNGNVLEIIGPNR